MDQSHDLKAKPAYRSLRRAAIHWGDHKLRAELTQLGKDGHYGHTIGAILGKETAVDRLAHPFSKVLDCLRNDLIDKLCTGRLVGFAFREGADPSLARNQIYPGLWRVLTPNFDESTAIGPELRFFDIWVTLPQSELTTSPISPPLIVDLKTHSARRGSVVTVVTDSVFKTLRLLAERHVAGSPIVSIGDLASIYGRNTPSETVRANISFLRSELGPLKLPEEISNRLIHTRSRRGYELALEQYDVVVT